MSKYTVINPFVDVRTGKRVVPGQEFTNPLPDQEARLLKANCIIKAESKTGKEEKTETPSKSQSRKKSK